MSHEKPIFASFLRRRLGMTGALGTVIAAPAAIGQCPTPLCPSGCTTVCEVTTQAELVAALCCHTAKGTCCSHIRIPAATTLVATSTIEIGAAHDGLHLEIQGAIRYEGPTLDEKLFNINGALNVLIDGGGTITSIFEPLTVNAQHDVATTFRILGGSSNVTIKDLTVTKMTDVVKVESDAASDLSIINVHGRNLGDYGIFIDDKRVEANVENCSMTDMLDEHPFRLYGEDIQVRNCWSHGSPKTGIWTPEGEDFIVDRFSSDKWLRFGPDNTFSGANPLTGFFARELHTTDYTRIEMGMQGGCLVNLCGSMTVGRDAIQVDHLLELNNLSWDAVSGAVTIITSNLLIDYPETVHAVTYNYCFADVVRNNAVDIDDLLIVMGSWGDCPAPPSGYTTPPPPCAGDIVPNICGDNVVDIDDLLYVLSNWGGCAAHPACGTRAAEAAGEPDDPPETIDDCWDKATEQYPGGGDPWAAAFEACLQALEELGD